MKSGKRHELLLGASFLLGLVLVPARLGGPGATVLTVFAQPATPSVGAPQLFPPGSSGNYSPASDWGGTGDAGSLPPPLPTFQPLGDVTLPPPVATNLTGRPAIGDLSPRHQSHNPVGVIPIIGSQSALPALGAQDIGLPPSTPISQARMAQGASYPGASAHDPLTVVEVRIVGNQRVSTERILGQIKTRVGRPFDPKIIDEDVRRLNQTRLFASVRVYWQPVPEGRIVIFEVVERPLIQYVKVVGNEWYPKKRLLEEAGIRAGDGFDPFLIEEARRRIERFYRERGFSKVRVTVVEGSQPTDPGVVFLISEGPRQRVFWTDFVGNTISSDARLRTKVQTKPGYFWLWRGFFDPEQLERDETQLIDYYRSLGFFQAKVGEPIVQFNEDRTWARVRFIVDEGPRYSVRDVRFLGNTLFPEEELLRALKLRPGKYFSQSEMEGDIKTLQEKYGSIGYVLAEIRAEPRFAEEGPQLDLVYNINESVRCRVGRIDVVIKDQYNALVHTQWSTVLNRISLAPGDIVDIRELRASERRLRASGLFEVDPTKGIAPKIVVVPPDPEEVEAVLARRRQGEIRGQSPGGATGWGRLPLILRNLPLPPRWAGTFGTGNESTSDGDCLIVLRLEGKLAPGATLDEQEIPEHSPDATPAEQLGDHTSLELPPGGAAVGNWNWSSDNGRLCSSNDSGGAFTSAPAVAIRPATPQPEETIIRGQYTWETGVSLLPLRPRREPSSSGTISPRAGGSTASYSNSQVVHGFQPVVGGPREGANTFTPPPQRPMAPYVSGGGGMQSSAPAGQFADSLPMVPVDPAAGPTGASSGYDSPAAGQPNQTNSPLIPASQAPSSLGQMSPGQGTGIYPSGGGYLGQSGGGMLPGAVAPQIAPAAPAGGALPPGPVPVPSPPPTVAPDVLPPLMGTPPDQEPTLPVPLQPEVYEGRTGRIMLSAGINSDAGLIGSIIIDEQNFDWRRWPRSWEDIRSGAAWRGAGQRFRVEAVPGTEVQRYMVTFQEPYLWDTDVSLGLSAFYYNRKYAEWDEDRLGGRVAFGYQFTHDLTGTFSIRAAEVKIYDPAVGPGLVPDLDEVLGSNTLIGFGVTFTHDTRDSAFLPTEGHVYEISFEQVIGSFVYPRAELELRRYFLLRQHPDGSGRHVLGLSTRVAYTGDNTPIYEHYFAGGYSSLRGFSFRGASPRDPLTGLRVGGHFMILASAEYMFPLTADDLLRLVIFCDTGAVQPDIDEWRDRYRVAPGFGFRITIPALGPAPIALDFAFPVSKEPGDDTQVFSFFLGFFR